jgi:AcrR family transcriptional regulator
MKGATLTRREREKLRQRQEMLTAAIELFSEKGFHNVSMQEIARRAEFAIGTLYKFFKNKEDLYRSIIKEQADIFHEALITSLDEGDNEIEKLRNFVHVKGVVFMDNVAVVRLYFAETRGAGFNIKAGLDKEIRQDCELVLHKLARVFAAGLQQNRFQKIAEPYYLAVSLDSLTNAFLHLWLETPRQHPYPDEPDVILNIFFQGLLSES